VVPALVCIAAGGFSVALYAPRFTLSWAHVAVPVEWRETWRVHTKTMRLVEAAIKGEGAGVQPPADAEVRDGWSVFVPKRAPQTRLTLVDGAEVKPVRLCLPKDGCRPLRAFLPREAPKDVPVVLSLAKKDECRPGKDGTRE